MKRAIQAILLCIIAAFLGGCSSVTLDQSLPKTGGEKYQGAQKLINGSGAQKK